MKPNSDREAAELFRDISRNKMILVDTH